MGRGGGVPLPCSSQALRPAKTGKTATTRTIDTEVVGNSPVQGNLRTSQLALSTVVRNSHRDSVHRTNSGEKTAQQQDSPSICDWEPSSQTPSLSQSTVLRHPSSVSKHWFTTSVLHLQALVYHIRPPSPSTGLPHPSRFSKHWCTTCFLHPQALVYKSSIPKHWFNTSFLHLQALVHNILHPQALVYDILHLQALVYDILHLQALVYHILPPSPSTGLRYPPSLSTGLRLLPPSPSTVFYPVGRASHLRACLDATLPLSQSWYQNLSEGAYGVGEELRRDKDCPFSGAKIFPTGKKDKSEWRIQFWQSVEEIAGKRCSECLEEGAGKRCLECLKEGAGKRCSECAQFPHSKPRFPAPWRKDVVNQSLDFAQLHLPVHTDSGLCYLLHMSLEVRDLASLFNSNRGCIDRPPAPPTPHPLHLRRVCVDLQDCCIRLGNDKKWKPRPTSPFTQSSGVVWKSRWPSWAFRPNEPYGFCGRKATLNRARSTLVTVCP